MGSLLKISMVQHVQVASSLSIRAFSRVSSALSALGVTAVGSSLSLRAFTRGGSALSLAGGHLRVGRAQTLVSSFDFVHVASSVSIRAFLALGGCGSGLSALDQAAI